MLIFGFILLFGSASRTGLHTLIIKKKKLNEIILMWFISAASRFTRCYERYVLATE